MEDLKTLVVEQRPGIIDVTLNRPESSNAISLAMVDELLEVIAGLAYQPDARVLLLKGAGQNFCGGFDVRSISQLGEGHERWLRASRVEALFDALEQAPVVKIAQLHGHVVGAGLLLAASCELRYAAPDTVLSVPELDLGIPFSLRGVARVARHLGLTRTADLVLNTAPLATTHPDALRLITEVVEADRLNAHVGAVADRLASRPGVLIMASVNSLRAAAQELAPASSDDLPQMFLALDDREARRARDSYSERFTG